jgi:hypothetical protein
MRRLRDLLCALAFFVLTSVSVWAAVQVSRQDYPDAAALEPVDLGQWLIERDLSQASVATRSRLARRFEEDLRNGAAANWIGQLRSVEPQQTARLQENFAAIMEFWYRDKVNRYFDQSPDRREAWLDREIGRLERVLKGLRGKNDTVAGMSGSLYLLGIAGSYIEQWTQRADPPMQERMREFQGVVRDRLMDRKNK